jgi:hypothetical protein
LEKALRSTSTGPVRHFAQHLVTMRVRLTYPSISSAETVPQTNMSW